MKYRILGGRWGEGWKKGDIVDMDDEASRVALQDGRLEVYDHTTPLAETETATTKDVKLDLSNVGSTTQIDCSNCGKTCKSLAGLKAHQRKCNQNKK